MAAREPWLCFHRQIAMSSQITRRTFSLLAIGGIVSACGKTSGQPASPSSTPQPPDSTGDASGSASLVPVQVVVPSREPAGSLTDGVGVSVSDFGLELFAKLAQNSGATENVSCSPLSIAIALAMVEPGAVGDAKQQLRDLLRIDDSVLFHAGMNALEQSLESRQPTFRSGDGDGDPGEIVVRVANAAYIQIGYPLTDQYLDTVGRNYGPVLNNVDFSTDPDGVVGEINSFVASATNDRITDLLAPGDINPDTVLALVNALFMRASWESTFEVDRTREASFTTLAGDSVDVAMMNGRSSASARGDGWIGASKNYVGDLVAQFVLPDTDRFAEIAAVLPDAFAELSKPNSNGTDFAMPRFATRLNTTLDETLQGQGLAAPYSPGGLTGIADDERLVIDKVAHETYVAFDEDGTEAAAATVVLIMPVSAPLDPVTVTLDRPFYYRIADRTSGATLFIGQVTNPTTS